MTPRVKGLPGYIAKGLRANAKAWAFFRELPPRERRNFVVWIHTAKPLTRDATSSHLDAQRPSRVKGKRPDTRERRIRESIAFLAAGKKLGLK